MISNFIDEPLHILIIINEILTLLISPKQRSLIYFIKELLYYFEQSFEKTYLLSLTDMIKSNENKSINKHITVF